MSCPSWWQSGGEATLSLWFVSVCLYSWSLRVSRAAGKRVCAAPAGTRHASAEDGGPTALMAPATATKPACPRWTAAPTMRRRAQVRLWPSNLGSSHVKLCKCVFVFVVVVVFKHYSSLQRDVTVFFRPAVKGVGLGLFQSFTWVEISVSHCKIH